MLATLLPGLRDLRTPLAAGYCLFLAVWLSGLLDGLSSEPVVSKLLDLAAFAQPVGLLTAASFAAYLIGSLMERTRLSDTQVAMLSDAGSLKDEVRRWLARYEFLRWVVSRRPVLWFRSRVWASRKLRKLHAPRRPYVDEAVPDLWQWSLENVRPLVRRGLTVRIAIESGGIVDYDHGSLEDSFYYQLGEFDPSLRHADYSDPDALGRLDPGTVQVANEWALIHFASSRAKQERDRLVTRLLIERQEVFQQYDRLQTEATLRFTMFLPLLFLAGVVAHTWLIGGAGVFVAACLLVVQGAARQRDSDRIIWQALASGAVKAPVMDAFEQALADWRSGLEVIE